MVRGEMQRSTDDSLSSSTTPFRLSSVKKSHDLNPKTTKTHKHTHTQNNMSVQAAWDNHFSAFGEQNVEKILLDYTEESEILIWDTKAEKTTRFKGLEGAKTCFTNLFGALSDLSTLKAPLVEVQEDPGMVFLVWECPGCGYKKVTDTFLFKGNKILRQNIVVFN